MCSYNYLFLLNSFWLDSIPSARAISSSACASSSMLIFSLGTAARVAVALVKLLGSPLTCHSSSAFLLFPKVKCSRADAPRSLTMGSSFPFSLSCALSWWEAGLWLGGCDVPMELCFPPWVPLAVLLLSASVPLIPTVWMCCSRPL